MTQTTYIQKTIVADTAEDFDNKMNALLAEANNPEIFYRLASEQFCAIVKYQRVIEHKTIGQRYEEMGEGHLCGECKYFEKPKDGRVKYTRCCHNNGSVYYGRKACDFFYDLLEAGEIILKGQEE